MKDQEGRQSSLLAVSPSSRGVGFAVFEGPFKLVDWGVKYIKNDKNKHTHEKVEKLVSWYKPTMVITEDFAVRRSTRKPRIRSALRMIVRIVEKRSIEARVYSRGQIRGCFQPFQSRTKHEIADRLSKWFPELAFNLPSKRMPWQSEDSQMAMFDAVALAITHFDAVEPNALADRPEK